MGTRIMVVDDSPMIFAQMESLLKDTEFEIAAYCQDGEEAVAQYDQVRPDLITMDIIMPGMDGLETAQVLLEDHPEARIVMVSSLAYDETFEEARTIGAKGFIDKPFEKDRLVEALQKAMEE